MAYLISTATPSKITLLRESQKGASTLFIIVGSIFVLIGIGLNVVIEQWEFPFLLFKLLFPAFGLMAVFSGIFLPGNVRKTTPEQITFDHSKGAVIIEMIKNGNEVGYIRYDEIEGFDIYVEKRSSSSSSSGRSSTYYDYHVFLKKKDGGEWFLTKSSTRDEAEVILNTFRTQVPLANPFTISPSAKLSSKLAKQEGVDKTVVHWQNKITWWTPIFLIFFATVFTSILSIPFTSFASGGPDVFILIVVGFIFTIFLLVMFMVVRKLLKDATTRYAISIGKTQVEYYEFSKSNGAMKNHKGISCDALDRIIYSYTPGKSTDHSDLKLLTKEDVAYWQKTQENPLMALKDIFKSVNQPITLSITALNPVECLQLETWLQELILKKSEKKVL